MSEQTGIIKGSAKRLKQIREKLKLTQLEFAELLGVKPNTAARWERGVPEPPKIAQMAAEHLLLTFNTTAKKKGAKAE